jgi:hypothetical protein
MGVSITGISNNPILMTDPLGDTTMYYDTEGSLLYTTYAKGATNAFIVNDKYLSGFKKAFSMLGDKASLEMQGSFDSKILEMNDKYGLGDAYDLNSISKFYEDNVNKNSFDKVAGTSIDDMKNITLDGKSVSKSFLKGLKGAEASFDMVKKNGLWVVDDGSIKTDGDLMGGPSGSYSRPNGHLHPYIKALEGKTLQYSYQAHYGSVTLRQGPFSRSTIPSGQRGDVGQAKREGKIGGTIRNVVVNYSHIYLYDGRSIGIQINRR